MALSRLMKKKKHKRQPTFKNASSPTTAIQSLPKDMLEKVVARVASHSFTDLHNMKMCCRDFLDASEDSYVWQNVSLDKFPLIQWFPNDTSFFFLKRCKQNGNIESVWRDGFLEFFCHPNGNIGGLEILKVASEKGHMEAKYMYGMILLCSEDDELRKEGLEHMRFLRKSMCVIACRKKVAQFAKHLWINRALVRNQSPLCRHTSTCNGWGLKKGRWILLDKDDDNFDSCEYCRWDHELKFFYKLFNVTQYTFYE
ncbi:F-box protein At2g35280-like [Abrus precatorius]|uniref:F-box protein At2g35280-like n=1 Tax=Abrus precatorius TaxID=3816 RepID=A0A8B8MNK3_ABRPR|nr:F-box protein At2g35280-like [Abrus precatorius]